MKTAVAVQKDEFLRYMKNIPVIRGLSTEDAATKVPFRMLIRTKEIIEKEPFGYKKLPRDPETLLCAGAACGIDHDGIVRHCYPNIYDLKGFIGFVETNLGNGKVSVWVRGAVILKIGGITSADVGKTVFCTGPNDFTLNGTTGGFAVGEVKFVQPDREHQACVEFKSYDDQKPLNLKY